MARTRTRLDEDKRRREALHERGMASIPGHKLDRWLLACQMDPCKEFDLGLLFNPTGFEIGMLLEYVCNVDESKIDELEDEIDDLKLKIDELNDEIREERDTKWLRSAEKRKVEQSARRGPRRHQRHDRGGA